ncbi:MAG TPA: HEAT repeat domain-containing protein [Gemmatimonadales bacterium]|nr:HEAT repeat domain-containing protein [Gemmatimonadales bacterium]
MSAPLSVVSDLWNVVALLRDRPNAKEEHKTAFRTLVSTLGVSPLSLTATPEGLAYQGVLVPEETVGAAALTRQMLQHGVGEIELPEGTGAAPLLSLLRALAAPNGSYRHIQEFITAVGEPGASRFRMAAFVAPPPAAPVVSARASRAAAAPPAPRVTTGSPPPRGSAELALGPGVMSSEEGGMLHFMSSQHEAIARLDELSLAIEAAPSGVNVGHLLSELVGAADAAAQKSDWEGILRAAVRVIGAESKVTSKDEGRLYSISLKRLLPRRTLDEIARFLPKPALKHDAMTVMQRMGESATDVLLDFLAAAPTIEERRHYFDALVTSAQGSDMVVRTLEHGEWFVIRNVAELCGELKLESAVPVLARHLTHPDERVKRAAIVALAKIGTPATVEPLRNALKDAAPAVRMQAVMVIDGKQNRALGLRLVSILEEETVPEVLREVCYSVGRSGSNEGVQALIRMASPGGKLFNKKPTQQRVWAIEGLRMAGGSSAQGALEGLFQDSDKEVREAAQKALSGMGR